MDKLSYKLSTAVYLDTPGQENVLYCRYAPPGGQQVAAIGAITKSMTMWYQRTDGQLSPYTWPLGAGETGATICPKVLGIVVGDTNFGYESAYNADSGSWKWMSWAQGGSGIVL